VSLNRACGEVDVDDGTPFGRYRLVELLGRGSMGEVWRAYDIAIDRVVALKALPAHAGAQLNEPHVVPINDFGEIDGRPYVTMRLIDGRDLRTVLAEGRLSPERAVGIIEQVAQALCAVHRVGLAHRDIKPSNILLDDNDFGGAASGSPPGVVRAVGAAHLVLRPALSGPAWWIWPRRARRSTRCSNCLIRQ
jgi:serine/threonine-protein kinase